MQVTPRKDSLFCVRALFFFVLTVALGAVVAAPSGAALFTLVDDNSSVDFDTATANNAYDWFVDGVDHLSTQAFWYRVGNVAEQSLHTLPIGVQGTSDTNFDGNPDTLFVRYVGAGFRADVAYRLDGGTPGSFASDVTEQITIVNTGLSPLDFHFFQYTDFDLGGTAGGDTAVFTNANAVQVSDALLNFTETVITPVPSHREIDFFANTVAKLTDAVPDNLDDLPAIGTPLGPGDVTWAYQWDFTVNPGQSFQISKDKQLVGVPEPATPSLAALAACFAIRRRRGR